MKSQSRKKVVSDCPSGDFTLDWQRVPGRPGVILLTGKVSSDALGCLRAAALWVADDLVRRRMMSHSDAQNLRDGDPVIHVAKSHRSRRPAK